MIALRTLSGYGIGVALALAFLAAVALVHAQQDNALVADLSESQIAITTGFTGTDVLLFGATDGIGDVVVVVRGPSDQITVRKKERVAGIWLNTTSLAFDDVPGYYRVAASGPIDTLLPADIRKAFQIGDRNIAITAKDDRPPQVEQAFFDALLRAKERIQLYDAEQGEVRFLGNRLFRTRISLPANVPTGRYTVDVYLVADGAIANRTTTPLEVVKSGFEEQVFNFAHERAALYGLIAIVIALVAGWFAGYVFRRI
ncbi:MAG: TIGR02186 family protein [Alphaproteobacteria bacterium]|jgi:uncharacterized protein (TIGR02186 family)